MQKACIVVDCRRTAARRNVARLILHDDKGPKHREVVQVSAAVDTRHAALDTASALWDRQEG